MAITLNPSGGTFKFGVDTASNSASAANIIHVISAEATLSYDINALAKDEDGDVVAQALGGQKWDLSLEGYSSSASLPAVGGAMTAGGKTGRITSVTVTASNENFVMVKLTGEAHGALAYA
jgi:hypothetical protein